MDQPEEPATGRHILAVALVAIIGVTGLVLMLSDAAVTGNVIKPRNVVVHSPIIGCNDDELMLNEQGVSALKRAGRAKYGEDWSPYDAAHINYNGIAYCANAAVVHELLG